MIPIKGRRLLQRMMKFPPIEEKLAKIPGEPETKFIHLALCYHLIAKPIIHMEQQEKSEPDIRSALLAAMALVEEGAFEFHEDEEGIVRAIRTSRET